MKLGTDRLADVVAVVTLGFGAALTVAPRRSGAALALDTGPIRSRLIGIADLVIGTALLTSRRRWPWMASRAMLNAALATSYLLGSRRPADGQSDHHRRARVGGAAMVVLTAFDAALAVKLAATRAPTAHAGRPT